MAVLTKRRCETGSSAVGAAASGRKKTAPSRMSFKSCALFGLLALARLTGAKDDSKPANPSPSDVTPAPSTSDSVANTTMVDTTSLNEPIPKPECDANNNVSIRYAATTGRLYLEGVNGSRGGCVTIDQIWEARGGGAKGGAKPPLYAVDAATGNYSESMTGTWLLEEDLYVQDGVTLKVQQCPKSQNHTYAYGVLVVLVVCKILPPAASEPR